MRRLLLPLVAYITAAGLPAAAFVADDAAIVRVSEEKGLYSVAAEFRVPQSPAVVTAVLRDYEAIPRFMPDVRSSKVIERGEGLAVVEQEAVARLMMFSKRIRLVLEVIETPGAINFTDRSGESFRRYEGAWRISGGESLTTISYEVSARPAFDVPQFILTRLLRRDATRMIENLRREMAARERAHADVR